MRKRLFLDVVYLLDCSPPIALSMQPRTLCELIRSLDFAVRGFGVSSKQLPIVIITLYVKFIVV